MGMDPMDIRKSGVAMSLRPGGSSGHGSGRLHGHDRQHDAPLLAQGQPAFSWTAKILRRWPQRIWQELEVVTPSTNFPVRRMSGGNVQKVLVGREIAQQPSVLMTAYAVRGLDINTSYTIYNLLTEQKMKGVAVVYVGEDLDVLLELCDRIVVLCGGQVSGVVDARTTDKLEDGRADDPRGQEARQMNKKGSLFHISKRDALPLLQGTADPRRYPSLLALVFCGLITTLLTGQDPIARLRHDPQGRLRHLP